MLGSGSPDKPAPPTINIVNLDVVISWIPPNDNFGGISSYIIKIAESNSGLFS